MIVLLLSYFEPLINKPTRFINHLATLTDNIFTNVHSFNYLYGILSTAISDHFHIFGIPLNLDISCDKKRK